MDARAELIAEIKSARAHMRVVVDRADRNRQIYPSWKIKQVVDHLTGWDDATVESFKAYLEGREPYVPATRGVDLYNEQTVTEREALDISHSIQEWEVTRQNLIVLIENAPLEMYLGEFIFPWGYKGTIAQICHIFIEHEDTHATEITEILDAAEVG